MLDEIVDGKMEALAQEFLIRQHGIDGPLETAQALRFKLVIALHVAEGPHTTLQSFPGGGAIPALTNLCQNPRRACHGAVSSRLLFTQIFQA
jgi:hypothetical protein